MTTASDQHEPPYTLQLLTFVLADEVYGIPILDVQEIRGRTDITPIPNSPPHIRGVMNLRGEIVPVLDLRARIGLPPTDASGVSIILRDGTRILGMSVDSVSDVVDVTEDSLSSVPDVHEVDETLLSGMARCDDRLILLLNVQALVSNSLQHTDA